jgi:hypothetical protein
MRAMAKPTHKPDDPAQFKRFLELGRSWALTPTIRP